VVHDHICVFHLSHMQTTMPKRSHDEFSADSPIRLHADLAKWDPENLPKTFPPLPPILNPELEKHALTHQGALGVAEDCTYERLEWLGDAMLETISSCFIYQTFPKLPPGKMSQIRELCVRNNTLSKFTRHYGLGKRAQLPPDFQNFSPREREKVEGDLFEAYVGALIYSDPSNGLDRASRWLKILWGNEVRDIIRKETNRQALESKKDGERSAKSARTDGGRDDDVIAARPAKDQLQALIGYRGVRIEYRDIPCAKPKLDSVSRLPLFHVGCYVTTPSMANRELGDGWALGKKEAGRNAAQAVLDNKKVMKDLVQRKKDYDALLLQQQAQQEDGEV
jgi:ribonuclease-3